VKWHSVLSGVATPSESLSSTAIKDRCNRPDVRTTNSGASYTSPWSLYALLYRLLHHKHGLVIPTDRFVSTFRISYIHKTSAINTTQSAFQRSSRILNSFWKCGWVSPSSYIQTLISPRAVILCSMPEAIWSNTTTFQIGITWEDNNFVSKKNENERGNITHTN
jgi:hypothetical protein